MFRCNDCKRDFEEATEKTSVVGFGTVSKVPLITTKKLCPFCGSWNIDETTTNKEPEDAYIYAQFVRACSQYDSLRGID